MAKPRTGYNPYRVILNICEDCACLRHNIHGYWCSAKSVEEEPSYCPSKKYMTKKVIDVWSDWPDLRVCSLAPYAEAAEYFGTSPNGNNFVRLSRAQVLDLLNNGLMLAWDDGEYCTFVIMEDDN